MLPRALLLDMCLSQFLSSALSKLVMHENTVSKKQCTHEPGANTPAGALLVIAEHGRR